MTFFGGRKLLPGLKATGVKRDRRTRGLLVDPMAKADAKRYAFSSHPGILRWKVQVPLFRK